MRSLLPLLLCSAPLTGQQVLPLPAFVTTQTAAVTRGFWFQAPVDFVITGLRVPDETTVGVQAVEVIDLGTTSPPPTFPGTTTGTLLHRATNQPANTVLPVNIPVQAGRFIGVLGGCGTTTLATSLAAAGTFTSDVFGYPLTMTRFGTQANIHTLAGAPPCWSEASGPIGRVEVFVAPTPGYAYAIRLGQGCYDVSRSFYEVFVPPTTFDLVGRSLQAIPNSGGYVFVPGGTFVPPSANAQSLGLADDAETAVTLSTSFPYAGGSTGTLTVCSNGYVSMASGNGTGYQPDPALWLQSSSPRFGQVHDFNPAVPGSGQVLFEEIAGIAYVTWNGVYDFGVTGTSSGNTFQLQFDTSNGVVTYVWVAITGMGNGHLVGHAAAGASRDLGSFDISAGLAGTWSTNALDLYSPLHTASARPQLGAVLALDTSRIDATSFAGATVLGLTGFPAGLPLDVIGMPQCRAYASPDVLLTFLPIGGLATQAFPIPSTPSLAGTVLFSQAFTLTPVVNVFGGMTSNGLQLLIEAN